MRTTPDRRPLELVLPDRSRVAIVDELTIGRGPGNSLRLEDASISRSHARVVRDAAGDTLLADAGSSYGTWLDGRRLRRPAPLRAGSRIGLGDLELLVDRVRRDEDAGPTIVVPAGASLTIPTEGRPRLRSGHAVKRLEAREGDRRWVLEDLRSGRFLRLSDGDGRLLELLDGRRTLAELLAEADRRLGAGGSVRLILLLASLGDRGMLSGTQAPGEPAAARRGRLRRALAPRDLPWRGAPAVLERIHAHGGAVLVRPGALGVPAVIALTGAIAFAYLVAGRYGTPFVVASKLGIGGLVFIAGRFLVAAVHELAHGLVLASFGRRVREAGLKRVLVFPYVYVDVSEAWYEPRRRRIAVSAAGPASDLALAGQFSLVCLLAAPGAVRDVLFQLAFGAYVAAFLNLNPLVERDGYHVLSDLLREPALMRKAREDLRGELSGGGRASPVLRRYALACVAWSVVGGAIAAALSLRYVPVLSGLASAPVVYAGFAAVWLALCAPAALVVGPHLLARLRGRTQPLRARAG